METVSNLSMYQIGSFSRLSSASLGVRQAHGKMGGRTIQISELLEFTQILLHNLYNLINIPVLIYPGISYYHNYKITIYIYQIFG